MAIGPALRQEIESTFMVVPQKSTSEELTFVCPECGDKAGHRSVNLTTGTTNCFRCGKGQNNKGNFIAWARALGYQFTSATDVSQVRFEDLAPKEHKFFLPSAYPVDLPDGFTLIADEPKSVYSRTIVEMAERKHLTKKDFEAARVGFTRCHPKWEPYAIFPVFDTGQVVYWQGRTYVDQPGESTKRFPSRDELQHGARFWVYNIDALRYRHAPIALVVESILNVLSLKKKLRALGRKDIVPVAVFKHRVSREQFARILQCDGLKEICFLFDHDAIDKTWAMEVPALGCRLSIAEMPAGENNEKQDPNDDVDLAWETFKKREPFALSARVLHRMEAQENKVRNGDSWRGQRISS